MLTSADCYFKDSCKKYKKINCECKNADIFCIKLFKLDYLYDSALLSTVQKKKINIYTDSADPDYQTFAELKLIEMNIKQFVEAGNNLYLHSMICGNGKTAWALKLLQAYLNSIWIESELKCRALFINVPHFLLSLKDSISNKNEYIAHIKENILDADLVVWDEVATKALTAYEHEHLLSLINARLDAGKSNIYTSNLQPVELKEKLGDRLYSRVVNYSIEKQFLGADKRKLINDSITILK